MAHQTGSDQARVSLEFFPPKGVSAERALMTGAHVLRRFRPEFQTVTFGADGSAVEGSLDWPSRLQQLNDVPTAAHITLCRFRDTGAFLDHASALWEQDINRLVVLRGDVRPEDGDGLAGFKSVADAIAQLKKRHVFDISAAAYPEAHPKALSRSADLDVMLAKQDAGADRFITQFFFDNNLFYAFKDRAEKRGLRSPIVPGVIPINNFSRIAGFAEKCGASVPPDFETRFAACGDDASCHTDLARKIISDQVQDLAENGVRDLHIYTLNRVDLTADTIRAFQAACHREGETPGLALAS